MSSIRCKMCGGIIETDNNSTVATCEYCGSEQTITKVDSEKKLMLFNRANSARLACDFEKALRNYESILVEFPNDAEAHWGVCLCRYGIEYVDDPKTKKKIPTCHRTIYNSIFDDVDYQEVLKNCDVVSKKIYQDEAEVIDRIQKNILAISQKEEQYDIFICYKETDENNKRTRDSFIAEDIYNELTNKGYKVFFSRISLESKLGLQYEPIIFAALQSAKVMLVIGSKTEYFEAVWVKNEWSRYLSFMAEQKGSKYMIPCYRDMEAYEMPNEFLSLQSQDLNRLGAKQDLLRAIDKVFDKDKVSVKDSNNDSDESRKITNLLKRACILIEDEDYDKADTLLEEVLNNDSECSKAYAYKILISKKLNIIEQLGELSEPLDNDKNYQKAIRFADDEYRMILESYNKKILLNLDEKNKASIYNKGVSIMSKGKKSEDIQALQESIDTFGKIKGYKDADNLILECDDLIKNIIYTNATNLKESKKYDEAIEVYKKVIYYKDSQEQIEQCKDLKENEDKERIYYKNKRIIIEASAYDTLDEKLFKQAIFNLKTILDYKDTNELVEKYTDLFNKTKTKKEIDIENKRIEEEKKAEERRLEILRYREEKAKRAAIRKDKAKRFFKIATPIVVILIVFIIFLTKLIIPSSQLSSALKMASNGQYNEAIEKLEKLEGFSDSEKQISMVKAAKAFEDGNYELGIDYIYNIGGTVDISYDGNGGMVSKENETIKKLSYVQNSTIKDGYTFYGWTQESYKINFEKKKYHASLSLNASWTPITYSISYDLNGGTVDNNPKSYIITDNVTINNPTKEGYTFIGWSGTEIDGLKKDLTFTDSFGNLKLTANWKANDYIITYDVNGGDELGSSTQTVTYDSSYTLATPTRIGYSFAGWYDENNNLVENGIWVTLSDAKLTARWDNENLSTVFNYKVSNGIVTLTGIKSTYSQDSIIIPTHIVGYQVEIIDEGFLTSNSKIKNITISNKIKIIKENAFKDCSIEKINYLGTIDEWCQIEFKNIYSNPTHITGKLYIDNVLVTEIVIENSNIIRSNSFVGLTSISNVEIGINVCQIEESAFTNMAIESITIPFVGNRASVTSSDTYQYPFGYIFGTDSYTGGIATSQQYYGSGTISTTNKTYFIPSSLKNVKVLGGNILYGAFSGCSSLTSIEIPNSVTSIGSNAFSECSSLTSIEIPNSVTSIGSNAFSGCSSLTSIEIPNSVTSIGSNAFSGCSSLTSIEIPFVGATLDGTSNTHFGYIFGASSYSDNRSYVPSSLKEVIISGTSIGYRAFSDCSSLTSITIPNSVTSIRDYAFSGCSSLENVYYEGSIEEWCKIQFSNSASNPMSYVSHFYMKNSNNEWVEVTNIEIPNTITSIGNYAFCNCSSLTSITIPNSVTSIGENAFYGCTILKSITIPNSVTSIGDFAFSNCSSLTSITIPNSVTSIGNYAFYNCSSLRSIVIPNSVTSIGDYAFFGCSSLTSITIPNSVTSIGNYAFYNCSSLTSIVIPNSITSIGYRAFYNCSSLTSIVIPNSVTSIGENAFYNCSSLENVTFEEGSQLTSIGNYAFRDCSSLTSITIPNSVTSIGSYAFYNCSSLESIVMPNSVTSIGENAFYGCTRLKSITIPNSVTSIGSYAFYNCSSLESIVMPNSVKSIGKYAFYNCSSLTSITIPNSVTSIGDLAFYGCSSLTSITIPNSVKSIGFYAFYNCSSLENVYYEGSIEKWNSINIDSSNSYLTNANRYYYSETKPTDTTNKYWHYVYGVITIW